MRWEPPITLMDFLRVVLVITALLFFARWMGYGNIDIHKGWGDPISFSAAFVQLPSIFVFSLLLVGVIVMVKGIRSSQ